MTGLIKGLMLAAGMGAGMGAAVGGAAPAWAQQFTTAAEVRPILEATKSSWVSLREYDGADLLYFTHLIAWRCGLSSISYSINGGPEQPLKTEPCYEGEAQPNAIKGQGIMPFVRLPLGSVKEVDVRIVYDDGGKSSAHFTRERILQN